MVLAPSQLSAQLQALPLVNNEAAAITNLSNAFINFMSNASANGIPINPAVLQTLQPTMSAAMTGLSTTGAVSWQAGVVALWTEMLELVSTLFPPATIMSPPPTLSTFAITITPVATANIAGNLAAGPACDALSAVIYTLMLGGTVTYPTTPPTVFPIL